jgi:hypothetical protein
MGVSLVDAVVTPARFRSQLSRVPILPHPRLPLMLQHCKPDTSSADSRDWAKSCESLGGGLE